MALALTGSPPITAAALNAAVNAELLANWTPLVGIRGYLGGLTLSNDGSTPNSVLDVAAGVALDSLNAVLINLASAFTKNTSGAWVAGSGNAGMGVGIGIANLTWYYVFAIINAGAVDIYFDTSPTAANKPAGTTAFRRIGAFRTDASSHILAFYQNGDTVLWGTAVNILANVAAGTTAAQTLGLGNAVPSAIIVSALLTFGLAANPTAAQVYYSALAQASGMFLTAAAPASGNMYGSITVPTNASGNIRVQNLNATDINSLNVNGWFDRRGRDA